MKPVTITARSFIPKGRIFLMADTSHPEADPLTPVDEADRLLLLCHTDYEQVVRDAIAIEQELPKWWRDLRHIEAALASRETHQPEESR